MVAAAVVGTGVAGALIGSNSARKAANTQADAANRATDTAQAQYWQTREDQAPWRAAGESALGQLSGGLGQGGDFNRDFTLADFQRDPGYQFRLDQGLGSVQGSAAARGSLMSGATLKRLSQYGQDYASGEYGKAYDRFNNDRSQRFNRLATVAGIGQTATNNVGTAGANMASQVAGNQLAAGNASAAGTIGQANAINGGLSNLQSLYQLNQLGKSNWAPSSTGLSAASGSQGWGSAAYYGNEDLGQFL